MKSHLQSYPSYPPLRSVHVSLISSLLRSEVVHVSFISLCHVCAGHMLFICHSHHLYVINMLFISRSCVTYIPDMSFICCSCVTYIIDMSITRRSCVIHIIDVSFICHSRVIRMLFISLNCHSYVTHISYVCYLYVIHMPVMRRSCLGPPPPPSSFPTPYFPPQTKAESWLDYEVPDWAEKEWRESCGCGNRSFSWVSLVPDRWVPLVFRLG